MAGFRINGITYVQENGKAYKIVNGKKEQIPQSVFNAQKKKFDSLPKAKVHYVEDSKSGWYYLKYPNGKIIYKDNKGNTVQKDEFMKHEGAFMSEDGSIKPYNWKTKLSAGLKGVGNFFADMVTSEQPVPKKDKNGNIIKDKHGNPIYEKNPDGTPKTSRQFDLGRTVTTVAVGAAIAAVCVLAAPVAAALGASAAAAAAIGTTVQVGIGAAFVVSGGKKMYDAEMENRRNDITNEQKIKNWENKGAGGVEAFMGAFMMKGGAKSYGKSKSIAADVAKNVEVKNKASFAQDGKLGKVTDLKNRWSAAKEGAKAYRKAKPNQEQKTETTEKLSDSRPKNADDALEVSMYKNAIKRSNDKGQLKTELKKNKNLTEEETTAIKDRLNELETSEKEVKDIEKTLADEKSSLEGVQEKINKLSDPQAKARLQARLDVRQLDMGDQTAVNNYYNQNFDNAVALDELASAIERTNKIKPEQKATQLRDIYQRQNALEPEVYPDVEVEIKAREEAAAKKEAKKKGGTTSTEPKTETSKPQSSMGWYGKIMRRFRTEVKEVKDNEGKLICKQYIDKKTGKVYKNDYGELGTYEFEYDTEGNKILEISRDAKGRLEEYTETKIGEDGVRYNIIRDENDNIISIQKENVGEFKYDADGKLAEVNGNKVEFNSDGSAYYKSDMLQIDVEPEYLDLPSKFKDVPVIDKGNGTSVFGTITAKLKGVVEKFNKKEKLTKKELAPNANGNKAVEYRNSEGKLVKTEWYDKDGKYRTNYFDEKGNHVKTDWGLGQVEKYYYDKNGKHVRTEGTVWWLRSKKFIDHLYEDANDPNKVTRSIVRNKNNRVLSVKDNTGSVQVEYFYDKKGNLTKIVQDKGDNAATVEVKFKNGDAYNAKNESPIANSYVERAKQCWEDANNHKPEIAEPKSGDVDVKPKKESDKKIVAVGVSQAGTLGGAVAADNKTVSYEMAEAISQAQAEEAMEEDGYEYTEDMTTEDEVPTQESVEEGNPTAGTEDPDGTTDETDDTTSDSDDASSDTSVSSPAPGQSSPATTTGSDGTTDKTGDVSDASSAQRTRTSDDVNASRNKGNNSASRTNRGNVSDKTVNVSTEKPKVVVQEDDITDDESKNNVRELSPQEKFSITHKVQEAKTEDEIADALRLLRKTGVFKGRKNLRRLLKNKRRYLRALESNNTKKMEKSQKRIDKYEEKVENFQTSADKNFEDKYKKKHKGDSIF